MCETASTMQEPSGYPKVRDMVLTLSIEIKDKDQEDYLFDNPLSDTLQLGFVADLFDMFNFEQSLGVLKINGETPETLKSKL